MIKNIFETEVANEIVDRINKLKPTDKQHWGKMSVDQMLTHCNIAYKYTFEPAQFKKPGTLKKFFLKKFVKKLVVGEKPYPRNGRTAPDFIIVGDQDFEKEKAELIENVIKAQNLGTTYFEGKENHSFGSMTAQEWNNLFYKHLDHHLTQFGV
ncbi:DUF1569 domain-containing protein [Sphingobacterium sp. SRCM116780]|uniref:DUF1569 domain-containing protein n=1 Tax=Sphingobacterium sp. SRCM116780 TaxID=2907623 RepID=UPI001F2CE077|nr:DUF1569 domain-containing protein [Sphingobacterium sp. SRCM116780]UIR57298.1 DUF1569 domain-containing protein [Sphingobacterium sp. SRCM116780]